MKGSLRNLLALVALVAIGCDSQETADGDSGPGADGAAGGGGVGGEAGEGGGAGGEAGMAGEGGAAGEAGQGGVGGEAGMGGGGAGGGECGDLPVIDLNADGVPDGDSFVLNGTTGDTDVTSGSCVPPESAGGPEVAVKFVAPSASLWQFSTDGSVGADGNALDTVVYALSDCNDGLSEIICNDDEGSVNSRILVQMAQGDTIFVVVDQFDSMIANDFVLTATPVQATAPQLDSAEAFVNQTTQAVGLRMNGLDPENDVASYNITVFNAAGEELGGQNFEFAPEDITQENGMFRAQTVLGLGELAAEAAGIRISVVDGFGLESDPVDADVQAPADMLMRGDECEPAQVFALCPEADACADGDDAGPEPARCVLATPPTITVGAAFINENAPFTVDIGGGPWQIGAVGLALEGTDPENNPFFVNVLFFDAQGAELSPIGDGEAGALLNVASAANGTWQGNAIISFAGACAEGAGAAFQACGEGGGAEEECLALAETTLRDCNADFLGRIASVRVVAGDETNKTGPAFEIAMVNPTPNAAEGDACGPSQTLGICADGQYCFGPNGNTRCGPPQVACAEGVAVTNLNDHMAEAGTWSVEGDSSEASNLVGGGSCGGGGPQTLYSFTAPAAGTYTAEIAGAEGDTLLFVRSHCGLADAEFELGCNDDIDTQGMNFLSAVSFEAEANQTVTIVVDGYQGGFAGPHTVIVQAQ